MDFVERIVNGKKDTTKIPNERIAEKLDTNFNFNFPQIPPYEGIQKNLLNDKKLTNESPDVFSKGLGAMAHQLPDKGRSIMMTDNTMNSIGTLNSVSLENLNQRNQDRMRQYGIESLEMT